MKNIKILLLSLFALGCLFVSCKDTRMDGMIEDKVYILKYDEGENKDENEAHNVFVDYRDFANYKLVLYKSGMGENAADVFIQANDSYLNAYNQKYNTDYLLLPENCYEFSEIKGHIAEKGQVFNIFIAFNGPEISKIQNVGEKKYVLPIQLQVEGAATDSISSHYLIIPVLE